MSALPFTITRFSPPVASNPRADDSASIRSFSSNRDATINTLTHPLLDGVLIQNISLPNDQNFQIEHKLGRAWRGWFETNRIVNNSTSNTIREGTSNLDRKFFLELRATSPIIVDIWVF